MKLRCVKHEEYFLPILTKLAEIWVGDRRDNGRIKKRTKCRNHAVTRTNRPNSRTLQQVSMELVIQWQGHGSGADSLEHKKLRLCYKQNSKVIINAEICHRRSTMKPSSVDSS